MGTPMSCTCCNRRRWRSGSPVARTVAGLSRPVYRSTRLHRITSNHVFGSSREREGPLNACTTAVWKKLSGISSYDFPTVLCSQMTEICVFRMYTLCLQVLSQKQQLVVSLTAISTRSSRCSPNSEPSQTEADFCVCGSPIFAHIFARTHLPTSSRGPRTSTSMPDHVWPCV